MYHKLEEDHLWIMSASIAFNIIICSIPFTLIFLTLMGYLISEEETLTFISNTIDNYFVGITPELKTKITNTALSVVHELSANTTITAVIGILGIFWTSSSLIGNLREVLNRIYKTKQTLSYIREKFRDLLLVLVLLLSFILSFTSSFLYQVILRFDETFTGNILFSNWFTSGLLSYSTSVIFTFIMFYLIFKIVPVGYVDNKIALISALSAAILSELLKILFIIYLLHIANYTKIYGTYSAIIAVIFWLYYSSLTFVIGAEIGQLYREKYLTKS